MPFPVIPILLAAGGGFGVYKLFIEKPSVQSLRATDPTTGASVDVAVPTTSQDPESGGSVIPPTSDDVSQVPSEQSLGVQTVQVRDPDGRPRWMHRRRRFIPPPIVPGQVPNAPLVIGPYGPMPMVVRSPFDVQHALNGLGFGPLRVDGRIGPVTTAATMRFQNAYGLQPVGYHPDLRAHLQNAIQLRIPRPGSPTVGIFGAEPVVASATKATPVAVAVVSNTPPVTTGAAVQVALNKTGANPPLKVDGDVGPKTVAATKAFQVVHGLVVDGVPGPKTRTALALAAMPRPLCAACVPTPYVDRMPDDPILLSRNEKFVRWAERHHLDAVNPLYHPRVAKGAKPEPTETPWGNILLSRNQKFLLWGAKCHLQSLVDTTRATFGLEGPEGTNPGADTYFKGAHLPFGVEGPTGTNPAAEAYFKGGHLPFGKDASESRSGATAYYAHAHLPFGAFGAVAPPSGGRGAQSGPVVHAAPPAAPSAMPPKPTAAAPVFTRTQAPPPVTAASYSSTVRGPVLTTAPSILASPPPPGQGRINVPGPLGNIPTRPLPPVVGLTVTPEAYLVPPMAPTYANPYPPVPFSNWAPAPTYDNPYPAPGGGGGYYAAIRAAQDSSREQRWVDRRDYEVAVDQAAAATYDDGDDDAGFWGDVSATQGSDVGTAGKSRHTGHGHPRHKSFG